MRYAYLHGFASSPLSKKGLALAKVLEECGVVLQRPDLNRPSFGELSYGSMLEELDGLDARSEPVGTPWRLIGSSLGGWLAARWAELHPERVDRLVLLCPGFDLASRWAQLLGDAQMAKWEREGALELPDAEGRPVPVDWDFVTEAREQPAWPEVSCPTRIIHGRRDETVPVDSSRTYAATRPHVELVEVDDDHGLAESLPEIGAHIMNFFGLSSRGASPAG